MSMSTSGQIVLLEVASLHTKLHKPMQSCRVFDSPHVACWVILTQPGRKREEQDLVGAAGQTQG